MSWMDLLRPKWKHSNSFVRLAAVGKMTSQATLAKIAASDSESTVRIAAVYRLTDQDRLAEVARTNNDKEARYAALENMTDPSLRKSSMATFDYNEDEMKIFRMMAETFNYGGVRPGNRRL